MSSAGNSVVVASKQPLGQRAPVSRLWCALVYEASERKGFFLLIYMQNDVFLENSYYL